MSVIADLVREAFDWLEEEGFRWVGEEDHLPLYSISTYERGQLAVRVHWDGRDHATWTVLARGSGRVRSAPGRQLGLGHLEPGGPSAVLLPDPELDPAPLRAALERDSRLLRTRGAALLRGEQQAWAELAALQEANMREVSGE
jgi:hypothetical protein